MHFGQPGPVKTAFFGGVDQFKTLGEGRSLGAVRAGFELHEHAEMHG